MISKRIASVLVFVSGCSAFFLASRTAQACSSDADCKGDRICQNGGCIDPGSAGEALPQQSPPPGQSSPLPYEPQRYQAPPPPPPATHYREPDDEGIHLHDGFYLRLGIGLGYTYASTKVESDYGDGELSVTGVGIAEEISFGGNIAPGLVLGGGIFAVGLPNAKGKDVEFEGESYDGEFKWDSVILGVVGPFIDYYFDPTQGTHFQAAVGIATMQTSDGKVESDIGSMDIDGESGTGFGAMLGIGMESWAGEQWSIGGLLRVLVTNATIEAPLPGFGSSRDADWKALAFTPSLLFTATYH